MHQFVDQQFRGGRDRRGLARDELIGFVSRGTPPIGMAPVLAG